MAPKKIHVLVIEDDPEILLLVSSRLEMSGYSVVAVTDAWQGLVEAQKQALQLIISDIQMPGIGTGADIVAQLRNMPSIGAHFPVIFITGMRRESARQLIPSDPFVRLLEKPIDFEEMRAAIKELIGIDRPL